MEYNFQLTEEKWRQYWRDNGVYAVKNDPSKKPFYVLDMFPYPSGSGLHVGHPLGYIASDIYARFKRHQGFNVLHPMGYDSYGLPAEQYAIQTGQHPAVTTEANIKRYREQLDLLGFSFDWSRQVKTSDPSFYRWTQWIFIQLFHSWYDHHHSKARPIEALIAHFETQGTQQLNAATSSKKSFSAEEWQSFSDREKREILLDYRLAYRAETVVNWCPALGTVLANDEVVNGVSERGGHPVIQKKMMQWSLRITAYAQRLLDGLDTIDWTDSLKEIQRNWIGKSVGAELDFNIDGHDAKIKVFTTRPDTIYGATFMVLAPEHPLVKRITTPEHQGEVAKYLEFASARSERERMAEVKEVTGANTGAMAIHPLSGKKIPVWISDYVLMGYGTGAVMAVPAGDQRDWDFAHHFGLEITPVIESQDVSEGADDRKDGTMINSEDLNGLKVTEAIQRVIEKAERDGIGKRKVNYKLRDSVFSRQRYWGEPFPIYYKDDIPYTIDEDRLDEIQLPEIDNFKPTESGDPPLGRAETWNWDREQGKVVPNGAGYPMDLNTMPGWAGSNWYYLRYMMEPGNPKKDSCFVDESSVNYWKQVDLYMGGAEHATGHLLYFRFITKFLHDRGFIPFDEPAKKLINQGMIQGNSAIIYGVGITKNSTNLNTESLPKWQGYIEPRRLDYLEKNDWRFFELEELFSSTLGIPKSEVQVSIVGGLQGLYKYRVPYEFVDLANGVVDIDAFHKYRMGKDSNSFTIVKAAQDSKFHCAFEPEKMSKSKGNVVNPDDVVADHGADALRLHEMFLGPIEMHKPWNTKGIDGVSRFLRKFWRLVHDREGNFTVSNESPNKDELKALHKCIQKVTDDMERFSFNTSVSAFMVAVNELTDLKCNKRDVIEPLCILMSCHAPHIAEEVWSLLGHDQSIVEAAWPAFDEQYLVEDEVAYPISFNGKTKFHMSLPSDMPKDEVESTVLDSAEAQKWLDGKTPKRVIVVPGRIVNIVI